MEKTEVRALNDFFNMGEGKKPLREFNEELKALSAEEKTELATLACAAEGWTLKTKSN